MNNLECLYCKSYTPDYVCECCRDEIARGDDV